VVPRLPDAAGTAGTTPPAWNATRRQLLLEDSAILRCFARRPRHPEG